MLAVAALSLAGCGGGSSADQSSATSADSSSSAGSDASSTSGASAQGAKAPGNPTTAQTGAREASAEGGGGSAVSGQGGQKHGPRIAQPTGPREKAPTPAEIANATVADMTLESYSPFESEEGGPGSLPSNYSCDGEDKWPQLHWSGVPAGTAELAVYAMNVQPVDGKLFVDWAVSGLDPKLPEIVSGRLPKGAVVGTNSFGKQGYSLCPSGRGEIYMFAVYALPKHLGLRPGFDARQAREEILAVSGNVGLLPMLYAHH